MMKEGFLAGQSTQPAAGPAGAPPSAPVGAPTMLTPAQVAQQLGVGETDVLATLESGDLKGKKIGTQWRISSEALTEFLKH
jgi:excisionase family DNA binding protein